MKKKIIEYIGRIQDGGAEVLIRDYALFINKDEFEIIVLCCFARKESSVYKTLINNNIKVIELYGRFTIACRILARIFKRFNSLLLSKTIKEIKPDVIHAHLELLESLYYSRDKLNGIKLLYTCHNLPETLIGSGNIREQKAAKYLIKNNNLQMIALHDEMAKEINASFNINNTVVIKNAIDINKFVSIKDTKEDIRKELGIPKNSYVFGNIGRLTYQKNPEFLINIFNEALKIKDDLFLIIVGKGKLENNVVNMINDYHIGDKALLLSDRDDIPRILKAMDVFVFPSRYEGLGIVLIEAQATGLPCIVSNKVPHEAFQSNLITTMSLNNSYEEWAKMCLNPKCNINNYGNISNYDMNIEIKKLESLYKN